MHRQDNFFILTRTSSTGKTTLLEHLRKLGFQCNAEAPREVLSHQRAIEGPGLHDPQVFVSMMLENTIEKFKSSTNTQSPVFFDRGMPDILAYARRLKTHFSTVENAVERFGYNKSVFLLPPWREIFVRDDFRGASFEE